MASLSVDVSLERPIDLVSALSALGRWGDDLIDRFDGRRLVRSISLAGRPAPVAYVAAVRPGLTETLTVQPAESIEPLAIASAVARTFVVADLALGELAAADRRVAALAARYPGHAPILVPDPFHALIRSISAQQVNLRWAATVRARLATRYGRRLPVADTFVHVLEPAALAATSVEVLRELQLTTAKARSVIAVARAAHAGELQQAQLAALDDEALIAHLTGLPGIGRWSAEWFLARTLGRPRVVAGDLGVRKAVGRLYDAGMPSEAEVRRLTRHWGAAATVAQSLALHDLAVSPDPAPAR
jgi:DNA-3-methyladenine glycosylase II